MFKGAVIVMGVTSCGKTSVGEGLAKELNCPFIEGDKLHPASNIAKMSAGTPLTDDDRWPWLEIIGRAMKAECDKSKGGVASCSALKRVYRQKLAQAAETLLPSYFFTAAGNCWPPAWQTAKATSCQHRFWIASSRPLKFQDPKRRHFISTLRYRWLI
jgi:hypothetical protein